MAHLRKFDPANGYVALPSEVMDIEMSPGAFRLLVELCRMANKAGESWPSLGQLGNRIGRSKAAISGYITELRALDLLETLNQRMANGYNYRLKYCVTFWKSWRASIARKPAPKVVQKTECTVQPVERRVNSKNQNHKNQSTGSELQQDSTHAKLVSVFSNWSDLAKHTQFPNFNGQVPEALVAETRKIISKNDPEPASNDLQKTTMMTVWRDLRVNVTQEQLIDQLQTLRASNPTATGLHALILTIKSQWKTHWKKPPSTAQFSDMIEQSQKQNTHDGMMKMLDQYLRRWEILQNKLQPSGASLSLSEKHAA